MLWAVEDGGRYRGGCIGRYRGGCGGMGSLTNKLGI